MYNLSEVRYATQVKDTINVNVNDHVVSLFRLTFN